MFSFHVWLRRRMTGSSHWDTENNQPALALERTEEPGLAESPWLPPSNLPTAMPRGHFPTEGCTSVRKQEVLDDPSLV